MGIYFRPHVLYNNATGLYVLWVRWLPCVGPNLSDDPTLYLVATSPSLVTPFTVVTINATMYYQNSADDNLFADADGSAYSESTAARRSDKPRYPHALPAQLCTRVVHRILQ